MKKYLKTLEDIEALRNTDTKIYCEGYRYHMKFINGVLCGFFNDGDIGYNTNILLSKETAYYIEVEDEPSEDWIGKIGWFWNDDEESDGTVATLIAINKHREFKFETPASYFLNFRPLTPEEVEKYTGYQVEKK